MELKDLKELEGKNVWVILHNNFEYNGIIKKIDDSGNGLIFIHLIDKFGKLIIFGSGEIKMLQEKE
jgi:hypothetical protein